MLIQTYLDTSENFQELIDGEINRLKAIEREKRDRNITIKAAAEKAGLEPELLKVHSISKARLFSAAIYAAATVDIDIFAKFFKKDRKSFDPPRKVSLERKLNKDVSHKFVFLRPEHLDYIQYRKGQLGMMYGLRFENDRDFVHMAIRYFSTLSKANAARFVALSVKIHPTSKRHEKPEATKKTKSRT